MVLRGATHCSACPVLRRSESGPLGLSVQMWGRRVCQCSDCLRHLSHTLPAPFIPHSASLSPATATRVLSTLVPVSAPTTSLDECLFSIFLVLVPLAVRFSVSSGCVRRRSVSTYAAILVPRFPTFNVSTKLVGDFKSNDMVFFHLYMKNIIFYGS